jgi:cobalamin synthase
MLSKVVGIAQSKWTLRAILGAWVLALADIAYRGWAWETHDYSSEGGSRIRHDYFATHRTIVFIWLSLILASYGAYYLKKRSVRSFGFIEIAAGLVAGYFDIATVPLNHVEAWIALIVAAYAVVSGAEHIAEQS